MQILPSGHAAVDIILNIPRGCLNVYLYNVDRISLSIVSRRRINDHRLNICFRESFEVKQDEKL